MSLSTAVLILKNQTGGALSYLSGAVTVAGNGQTTVSDANKYNLAIDGTFLNDINTNVVWVNDGISNYQAGPALTYLELIKKNQVDTSLTPLSSAFYQGTFSAQNNNLNISVGGMASATLNTTGSWVGIIAFYGSAGDGIIVPINGRQVGASSNGALTTQITSNNLLVFDIGSYNFIYINALSWTSGSAVVSVNLGLGSILQEVISPNPNNFQVNAQQGTSPWAVSQAAQPWEMGIQGLDSKGNITLNANVSPSGLIVDTVETTALLRALLLEIRTLRYTCQAAFNQNINIPDVDLENT